MILLDIDGYAKKYMSANGTLKSLMEMEKEGKEKILSGKTLVCVLGSVGSKLPKLSAVYLRDLQKKDFGEGLHSLIIPGKLHFMEAEALVELAGAPKEILKKV